jgi:NAD(P)-dependent dehydrogenase (short-subunit alcohol dehydrogenase family)
LITGGGNGIGRAVAHRFARAGMTVVIADYDHAAAEQVRGEVVESGAKADALSVDVTVAREVMTLMGETISVKSEPGMGTTFSFTLKRASA